MTDNRTTELLKDYAFALRRLEYAVDKPGSSMTLGEYEAEEKRVTDEYAQAIAATLWSEREMALEELVLDMWHELNYTSVRAEDGCNKCLEKMAAFDERMKDLGLMEVDE